MPRRHAQLHRKRNFTTKQAAEAVGISQVTLQRWIALGKIKAPKPVLVGAVGYRFWSKADVERLRSVKALIYDKGHGPKPKAKRRVKRAVQRRRKE